MVEPETSGPIINISRQTALTFTNNGSTPRRDKKGSHAHTANGGCSSAGVGQQKKKSHRQKEQLSRRERATLSFMYPESKRGQRRQRTVQDLLHNRPLVVIDNIFKGDSVSQLRLGNLERLQPGGWLHGEAIDWVLFSMAGAILSQKSERRMLIYATHFLQLFRAHGVLSSQVSQYHWNEEQKQTNRGCALTQDYEDVLIPINLGDAHWALARLKFADGIISVFDSCPMILGRERRQACEALMLYIVHVESAERGIKKSDVRKRWRFEYVPGLPVQHNDFDCGVFVCAYAEALMMGKDVSLVTQEHVSLLRVRMLVLSVEFALKY